MTVFKMIEAAPGDSPEPPWYSDKRPGRLLVVFHEGVAALLDQQGGDIAWEAENVGTDGLLKEVGDPPSPGVWVWSGGLVDDGPGDWPGSRECRLDGEWRSATAEELRRFRDGEWVWDAEPADSEPAWLPRRTKLRRLVSAIKDGTASVAGVASQRLIIVVPEGSEVELGEYLMEVRSKGLKHE